MAVLIIAGQMRMGNDAHCMQRLWKNCEKQKYSSGRISAMESKRKRGL